jgi:hypothetical protein
VHDRTVASRISSGLVPLLGAALACTEPNPLAQEAGADETGEPPGCNDPAACLGLEYVTFSVHGDDVFTTSIPKPPQQETVPIATVRRYENGQSDNLGYAIVWTDNGDSWELEVTTTNAANNSRVEGVAAVIGLGANFDPPEMHELQITTADGCGQLTSTPLDGRFFIDAVERYQPGDAAVFDYSRTANVGDTAAIEYCVTQPDNLEASIGVKLVAFDVPEGALALAAAATLDSGAGAMESFGELGTVSDVLHLVGAHARSEAAAPQLGYQFTCNTAPPYACNYTVADFTDGAVIEVGGAVLAIQ